MANVGDIGRVSAPIENSHAVGNKMRDMLSRIDGVNLEGTPKGTGNKIDSDTIKKYIRDIEGRTGRELPKNQIEKLKEAYALSGT